MILNVTIKINKYGSMFAYAPFELFQFEWRKDEKRWLFWLRGQFDPDSFPEKEFPMKYFEDACRAKFFIKNGGPMPDSIVIDAGKELITKATKKRK